MSASTLEGRDLTQHKTFVRWVNLHLSQHSDHTTEIVDLNDDLFTGETLCKLAEVLIPTTIKYKKSPKNQLMRTNNHSSAIEAFEKDGCELMNIHASTLAKEENNLKIFMGMVFQLILRYSIATKNAEDAENKKKASLAQLKEDMIAWVNSKLATLTPAQRSAIRKANNVEDNDDDIKCTNLDSSWQDGTVISGLTIALHPDDKREHGLAKLGERAKELGDDEHAYVTSVVERSEKNLAVPRLVDAKDIVDNPDANSLLTLCTYYKNSVYTDDEPEAEQAVIDWVELEFLQREVEALEANTLDAIKNEIDDIETRLNEYNENVERGVEYQPSCHRLASRMAFHVRRLKAAIQNSENNQSAADALNGTVDEANKRADENQAKADEANKRADDLENEKKEAEEKLKKAEEERDAAQAKVDELTEENAKLAKDLAKLQKKTHRLDELQRALLLAAEISEDFRDEDNE